MGENILIALVFFALGAAMGAASMQDFMQTQIDRLKDEIKPFDRDGDGHIGGSRRKAQDRPGPVSKGDWMA